VSPVGWLFGVRIRVLRELPLVAPFDFPYFRPFYFTPIVAGRRLGMEQSRYLSSMSKVVCRSWPFREALKPGRRLVRSTLVTKSSSAAAGTDAGKPSGQTVLVEEKYHV